MAGGSCQWPVAKCRHQSHARWRAANGRAAASGNDDLPPSRPESPRAVTGKDLHGLCWWLVEQVLGGDLETSRASVVATLVRVLLALGREPVDQDEMLRRAEIHGLLMHGVPPRTPDEWERAERILSPETLEMVKGWAADW